MYFLDLVLSVYGLKCVLVKWRYCTASLASTNTAGYNRSPQLAVRKRSMLAYPSKYYKKLEITCFLMPRSEIL